MGFYYQAMKVKPLPDKKMILGDKIIFSVDDYEAYLKNKKWLPVVYPNSEVDKLNRSLIPKEDLIPYDQELPPVRSAQLTFIRATISASW